MGTLKIPWNGTPQNYTKLAIFNGETNGEKGSPSTGESPYPCILYTPCRCSFLQSYARSPLVTRPSDSQRTLKQDELGDSGSEINKPKHHASPASLMSPQSSKKVKQKQLLCILGDHPVPPWALRGEAKKRSSVPRPSTGGLAVWIAPPTASDSKLSQVWLGCVGMVPKLRNFGDFVQSGYGYSRHLWTTSGIILSKASAGDLVPDLVRIIPGMERNHKKNVKPPIVP